MAVAKRGKADNRLKKVWSATLSDHCISMTWSPDGRWLATAAVSGPITVWDAATGKPQYELPGHGFGTTAVQWQPTGALLASTGQDGEAKLWNMAIGQLAYSMKGGAAWVEKLAWFSDGQLLATGAGKKVRLWDAAGTMIREYPNHASTVLDLAWRPGTRTLATAAYGGIVLFDPDQAEPVKKFEWQGSPLVMAWSPNGLLLAHGNQDSTVHFWFAETAKPLQMSGFPTKVRELSWDCTSRYLATGGGAAVCVWDCTGAGPEGRKPQMLLEEDAEQPVRGIAWQRRGFLIASTYVDGRIRLWQPANRKEQLIGEDRFADAEASTLAWSPDDRTLAVGSGLGAVTVYRVA